LYTKALENKEYFTHIVVQRMTKSSRDIQDFPDMKFRIFGQAVSIHNTRKQSTKEDFMNNAIKWSVGAWGRSPGYK
jgi:hypothetical protein